MKNEYNSQRFISILCLVILGLWGQAAFGQAWSGVVAPSRAVDWSKAGVVGGIPNYTTIFQTLSSSPGAAFPPADMWMSSSGQTVGTAVTAAIMNAWSHPNNSCWSLSGTAGGLTVGASTTGMNGSITTPVSAGTTYPIGTTTQSLALNNADSLTYALCSGPPVTSNPIMNVYGYVVFNAAGTAFPPVWDKVRIDGTTPNSFAVAQFKNGNGAGYCMQAHGGVGGTVNVSATCTQVTAGKVYYIDLESNQTTEIISLDIFDPSTYPFTQVGGTLTVNATTSGFSLGKPSRYFLGNVEAGTSTGTDTWEDFQELDSATSPFPILPTGGALSSATINAALASCPAGEVVKLAAGTYTGLGTITWNTSCVLRGAGADQTLLQFSSSSGGCSSLPLICMQEVGGNSTPSGPDNGPVNITGTMTQGSTTLTFATVPNLKIGNSFLLDQCPEGTSGPTCTTGTVTDNGGPLETDSTSSGTAVAPGLAGPYSGQGNANQGTRLGRNQTQVLVVTGCNGSTTPGVTCTGTNTAVTFTPGLYDADWSTSNTPQAWWATAPISKAGVEDLSIDASGFIANGVTCIGFHNAINSWVKGVRTVDCQAQAVTDTMSAHLTMQRSYHYLTQKWSIGSYGYGCYVSSDNLVENNIFQAVASPRIYDGCEGTVFGYNYDIFNFNNTTALNFNYMGDHGPGDNYNLNEGNIGNQLYSDWIHGTHQFGTDFRNYLTGPDKTCWQSSSNIATSYTAIATGTFGACTSSLSPMILQSFGRFYNVIGDVLGTTGTNTTYNTTGSAPVYLVGQGGTCSGCTATVPNDPNVLSTRFFWGVSDPTNGGAGGGAFTVPQFNSGEVPSGLSGTQAAFANSVPATHVLPASFYYSSKPPWWPALKPWPLIGPDITGGNVSGVNGLVNTNGAQDCFTLMGGPTNGVSTSALTFNENTCFPLVPTASTPSCAPGSGIYLGTQTPTCTTSTGPTICWRVNAVPATNGTTGCAAGSTLYTGAITVSSSETLQVIAGGTGYNDGSVVSYAYTITGGGTTPSGMSNGGTIRNGGQLR